MILSYLTLVTGLLISGVAAFYSIIGLTTIFVGAYYPIIVMGSLLEIGKLVVVSWLYNNWKVIPSTIKYYFTSAVIILMLITSMGIFGFLSKAYSDHSLVNSEASMKIAIIDEKIKVIKDSIDGNRRVLKQLDESVDQIMARSSDEKGADKAAALRKAQSKERTNIITYIETEQKKLSQLIEERTPYATEIRKVEAEVGPLKYVAALFYGDDSDKYLDSAVRWLIIIIMLVFDPLAVLLIIAYNMDMQKRNQIIIDGQETNAVATDGINWFNKEEVIVKKTIRNKDE